MPARDARAVERLPIAMASLSVGRATQHELRPKLMAISEAGFNGVEVFYEDLKLPARRMAGNFNDNLLATARNCRELCDEFHLQVTCLQPFKNYEGLLSEKRHAEKIEKLRIWIQMAHILNTDLIMIPSMFHKDSTISTGKLDKIVADLREVVDIGSEASPPIRFAYENMAWGAHVSTWQQISKIVELVARPSMGLCLDTFQVLGSFWADPTSVDGKVNGAEAHLQEELDSFVRSVPANKIFYVQIADGVRLDQPLDSSHPWYNAKQHPRLTWSRNGRLFPGESDCYLPVLEILKTWLINIGYRGHVGFELFNKDLFRTDASLPEEYASRGMTSWKKIVHDLKLDEIPA